MQEFRYGAIAIMDALGVKGIWQTAAEESTEAVATLRTALATAEGMKHYVETALVPRKLAPYLGFEPKLSVLSLSDTLVVAAQMPAKDVIERSDAIEAALVDLVCQCVAYVMRKASQESLPLVYRGVVTAGRLLVDGTFLLGPAVDEAGQLFESADGAFVWLAPGVARLPHPSYGGPDVWRTMVFEYPVPLKEGRRIETKALSPFVDLAPEAEDRAKIRAGYERAMRGDRFDVTTKRQNTMAFLNHVYALSDDGQRSG